MLEGLPVALNMLVLIASFLMLWKGADYFVDGAISLARRLKVSELTIGLTFVGFGTSAPEFAVSIGAALTGRADISVANIVGSNIFNLGFILGGCAALTAVKTTRLVVYRDGLVLIATTCLLALFLLDLRLERWEGVTLFTLLLVYIVVLFRQERRNADDDSADVDVGGWSQVAFGFLGLVAIVVGAHLLVESASEIARRAGLSEWAIGVTIVAAGTSAPELVTALTAIAKGRHGISAGALIGSDLYNLLGVLGVAGMIHPMSVDPAGRGSVWLLVGMVVVVVAFMRTGWVVSRKEGLFLVAVNMIRWWFDTTGY